MICKSRCILTNVEKHGNLRFRISTKILTFLSAKVYATSQPAWLMCLDQGAGHFVMQQYPSEKYSLLLGWFSTG